MFGITFLYAQELARKMGFNYYKKSQEELSALGIRKAEMVRLKKTGMTFSAVAKVMSADRMTVQNAFYKAKAREQGQETPTLSSAMLHLAKFDSIIGAVAMRQKAGEGADAAPLPQSYPSRAINPNVNFHTQRPVSRYSR